jgi:hypothetical protein
MKKSSAYVSGLILASSTILFSCTKADISEDVAEVTSKKKIDCEITAFRYNTLSENGTVSKYVFQKQIDPSTGRLQQIKAAVYQGGAIMSNITLDVLWGAGSIAFVKSGSATDTMLVVALNAQGRPASVVAGNAPSADFLPTTFEYSNNRVSAMRISLAGNQLVSRFIYDNKGNCTLIQDESRAGEIPGRIEYTYSNKKADKQVYFDEPRPFSWNTFSLMQFSGFLNELNPNNLRTAVKVWWGNNYKAYDVQLVNHQVEGGSLMKYDVSYSAGSNPIPHYIEMQCDNGLFTKN